MLSYTYSFLCGWVMSIITGVLAIGGIIIIIVKRIVCYILLMLFLNIVFVVSIMPGRTTNAVAAGIFLSLFYIYYNLFPRKDKSSKQLSTNYLTVPKRRLRLLIGGYELTLAAIVCFTLEIPAYIYILVKGAEVGGNIIAYNGLLCAALLFVMLFNGILRIFFCSGQLGIMPRICFLLFWWMPIVNIILLRKFMSVSNSEYEFTVNKQRINADRKSEELCKTKYPILMVHGIFFRDWKNLNYWGRIPKELINNGATIFYGNHQSSASVEQCAAEIKGCILEVVEKTGCEKVNIIAHSKGGLDSRYAISCFDMGKHVASLTTINTPHLGCNFVRKLLEIIPHKAVMAIGKKYESVYSKLGDDNPDFFSGLKDLTDEECLRLNSIMTDDPNVLYQSVGSRMRSHSSAMFPLNVGYFIIKYFGGGENDGLVSANSMKWGNFLGELSPVGKQGISHGDVIDLTGKNIEGFDVCEFYVDLAAKLKLTGL